MVARHRIVGIRAGLLRRAPRPGGPVERLSRELPPAREGRWTLTVSTPGGLPSFRSTRCTCHPLDVEWLLGTPHGAQRGVWGRCSFLLFDSPTHVPLLPSHRSARCFHKLPKLGLGPIRTRGVHGAVANVVLQQYERKFARCGMYRAEVGDAISRQHRCSSIMGRTPRARPSSELTRVRS